MNSSDQDPPPRSGPPRSGPPTASALAPKARPAVVIIGGGFAGLDAARAFAGADVAVTIVDRHNHHVFQPLLYQVATAALSPGDIASPIRWIFRRQSNVRVWLGEVTRVRCDERHLELSDGTHVPYDYL